MVRQSKTLGSAPSVFGFEQPKSTKTDGGRAELLAEILYLLDRASVEVAMADGAKHPRARDAHSRLAAAYHRKASTLSQTIAGVGTLPAA